MSETVEGKPIGFNPGDIVIFWQRCARVESVTGAGYVLLDDSGHIVNCPASTPLYKASAVRAAGFKLALGLHQHDTHKFASPAAEDKESRGET